MNLEKHIYTSSNSYSFLDVLKASLKGFQNSFYLANQLAKRDIKAQYRQSFLGVFWAIFPLLVNSLVWIFLQSSGTIQVTATKVPYPAFVLIGTTLWGIIGECINLTTQSVNANKSIITKINFDKEALITLGLIKFFFNFLIKIGLIILFLIFFKIVPSIEILFFIPLLFLSIVFFVAIGTLLMPISLLYNDISRLIPIALQFLMYATPVVYAIPHQGVMRGIMLLNPLTYIITDLRNLLTGYSIENPVFWFSGVFITAILSTIALVVYRVSMPILTERMS
ncbi:lipopolysaccharide transport system permease protein [Flavobacterium aquidurense]|uniref:ABC transporter permease n=1 Tax=Flavobacterium frigidimaris TaxID=262320 RepID=UPI000894F101|nr:ABC transporter permease [Flavobacterium frigidimaris]SDZ04843.1 lipopolysaccharide transport system permease protein [Flavobacterium aquidurense]